MRFYRPALRRSLATASGAFVVGGPDNGLKRAGKLDPDAVIIDGVTARAFGDCEATGPRHVDRRKPDTKHTLMVDRHGAPDDPFGRG